MKTKLPSDADPALRSLLREWNEKTPLPAGFRENVWRRIEHAKTTPVAVLDFLDRLATWIGLTLSRPAPAASYLLALLVLGAAVGWAESQQKTARVSDELSHRYVRSHDPYQTLR